MRKLLFVGHKHVGVNKHAYLASVACLASSCATQQTLLDRAGKVLGCILLQRLAHSRCRRSRQGTFGRHGYRLSAFAIYNSSDLGIHRAQMLGKMDTGVVEKLGRTGG